MASNMTPKSLSEKVAKEVNANITSGHDCISGLHDWFGFHEEQLELFTRKVYCEALEWARAECERLNNGGWDADTCEKTMKARIKELQ